MTDDNNNNNQVILEDLVEAIAPRSLMDYAMSSLDASRGTLIKKRPDAAYELLDEMASNSYQWQSDRVPQRKAAGLYGVDSITVISAQLEALNKKIDNMSAPVMQVKSMSCDLYGGDHRSNEYALLQMSSYAKFLKEILSNKRKLEEQEIVKLTKECASINLMPLSVFRKLRLGEPRATTVSLQLAYRSIKYLRGIMEDMLVKVDKFIFPVDFLVLDMEEDVEILFILGQPFLAIGKTLIDVQRGELIRRVRDEKVMFDVFKTMKLPLEDNTCFRIDAFDPLVREYFQDNRYEDPLEACLVDSKEDGGENKHLIEIVASLKPIHQIKGSCDKNLKH
ncbi:uncharacterized protein LOC116132326 [Pistacia vera]|uniref:uncharacterized protein LOC116132326 n=1 Tax=Pistacia vera TaxID=55513 RepID=UPI0012637592|nr:uncharacterized protein LOC116132326 [Pistacia vera]